jgi:hypothetical protein
MRATEGFRSLVSNTIKGLKGTARRIFMADVADQVGGQRRAAEAFGWGRETIRKGRRERDSGIECIDALSMRGTKPLEQTWPQLIGDIRDIAESFAQTDPKFKSGERYLRLSVSSVVQLLIDEKGYENQELPSNEAIRLKLHAMGFKLRKVRKTTPKKTPADRRHFRADSAGEPSCRPGPQ